MCHYDTVKVPGTVKLHTTSPPAGAGNDVFVFVPGLTESAGPSADGTLIKTIPDPPDPPLKESPGLVPPPPPPPPVLAVPDTAAS